MISWHNAPEYSHKGYIYRPEVEHEDVIECWEHSPYSWMTLEQAKEFINKMIKVRS